MGSVYPAEPFLEAHWHANPHFHTHFSKDAWLANMQELITQDWRVEGYLHYNGYPGSRPVGATVWNPAIDPHYGEIAIPVVDFLFPYYRSRVDIRREFSKLRKQAVAGCGAVKYLTVQHLSPTEQRHRLRFLNVSS